MLKQRIITALVMLAILVPVVAHPDSRVFAVVVLALIAAGAWEMGRLTGWSASSSLAIGFACAGTGALVLWAGGLQVDAAGLRLMSSVFWVLFSAWVLHQGAPAWMRLPAVVRCFGGVVVLLTAWLAASRAHVMGMNFLLSVLCLVWAADIGAYFVGRSVGGRWIKRKLAPTVSPGKTWEGALGGLASVFLVAAGWRHLEQYGGWGATSVYARLWEQGGLFYSVALLFLVTFSVVGDLVESLVKRSVGAKDSSGLLPGHGGILDRVDALLPVLPMALMLVTR